MSFEKQVTSLEYSERRQAMDVPAGAVSRENMCTDLHAKWPGISAASKGNKKTAQGQNHAAAYQPWALKGKHRHWGSDEKTRGHSTPSKHLFPEHSGVRCFRLFTWISDANRIPLIVYPILPPPSFLEVPLLPARYKQMSGGKRQRESAGEKYQKHSRAVCLGYPSWGPPQEAGHSSKSDRKSQISTRGRRLCPI